MSRPIGARSPGWWLLATGRPRSRWVGVVGDADHLAAGDVRPVMGRIGGHRLERFVWPPGPAPSGPEAIGAESGCWIKPRFV